jgi:hypothetical protein
MFILLPTGKVSIAVLTQVPAGLRPPMFLFSTPASAAKLARLCYK